MNRSSLSKHVAHALGCTPHRADQLVRAVLDGIVAGTCEDGRTTLSGFGTFERRKRRGRRIKSPFAKGQDSEIRAGHRVGFRAGKGFKEAIDRPPDTVAESA